MRDHEQVMAEVTPQIVRAIRAGDDDEVRRLLAIVGTDKVLLLDGPVPHVYYGPDGDLL